MLILNNFLTSSFKMHNFIYIKCTKAIQRARLNCKYIIRHLSAVWFKLLGKLSLLKLKLRILHFINIITNTKNINLSKQKAH